MKKAEIAELVADRLRTCRPGKITIEVVKDGVRRVDGWWHVPVRATRPFRRTYRYYEELTRVEDELETKHGLKILLVPTG